MNKVAQFLLLLVVLAGCSNPVAVAAGSPQERVVPQPILGVVMPDSVALGDTLIFSARVFAPNPCWHHDHFAFTESGDTVQVTAFGRRGPNQCVEMITSYWAPGQFIPNNIGGVTFRFLGQDSVHVRTVTVYPK